MTDKPDSFVKDSVVAAEFGIGKMALWRWTHDPALGFPQPIKINDKNYRSRSEIEAFKEKTRAKSAAEFAAVMRDRAKRKVHPKAVLNSGLKKAAPK